MIWGTTPFKVYASQLGNRMLHTVLPAHVAHWQQISKPEPPWWEPLDEERGHSWAIPKTSAGLCSGSPPLRLKCKVESVHWRTHMLCWTGYLLLPLVDKLLCAVRSLGNLKRTLRSKRTLLLTLHLPIWIYPTFMNLFALDRWSSSVKFNSVTTDFMNRCLLQRQAVLRCPFDQFQEFQASRATPTHAFCYLFIHHTSVNPWEEVLAGSPHDWSMTPGVSSPTSSSSSSQSKKITVNYTQTLRLPLIEILWGLCVQIVSGLPVKEQGLTLLHKTVFRTSAITKGQVFLSTVKASLLKGSLPTLIMNTPCWSRSFEQWLLWCIPVDDARHWQLFDFYMNVGVRGWLEHFQLGKVISWRQALRHRVVLHRD